jgi:hypothetical protein
MRKISGKLSKKITTFLCTFSPENLAVSRLLLERERERERERLTLPDISRA